MILILRVNDYVWGKCHGMTYSGGKYHLLVISVVNLTKVGGCDKSFKKSRHRSPFPLADCPAMSFVFVY